MRFFLRISTKAIESIHNLLYNVGKVVRIYGKKKDKRFFSRPGI